ncbi:hypothetical protein LTR95_004607 [Oleoguttula sp. CCFEE 5521]
MHTHAAIHFTDPFAARQLSHIPPSTGCGRQLAGPGSEGWHRDFNRALTPPPDMHGTYHADTAAMHRYDERSFTNDGSARTTSYRAPASTFAPYEVLNCNSGSAGVTAGIQNHTLSPTLQAQFPRQQQTSAAYDSHDQSRRSSQNTIATGFQIPRSVNSSGGSLSELAAQITCLFWFESSDLLQQIEKSPDTLTPTRKLAKDAIPTTGFRKWVTTILSTTLVAQNVVLLALLFIHRLKKLNPAVRGKPGSEYRLLTVALMLGNKFLDDNTYTNKTWAEVSGINVGEVHIMEVEFLSNMKYWLLTSAEDWAEWQTLLGKYALYFDRATHPVQIRQQPPPILPPASSLYLPMALPSPPTSNHASPPFGTDLMHHSFPHSTAGATPAPSPLRPVMSTALPNPRKRSRDDTGAEPPMKRIASGLPDLLSAYPAQSAQTSRLTLPSLAITPNGMPNGHLGMHTPQSQQLPPLNVPARAMALAQQGALSHLHTNAGAVALPPLESTQQHSYSQQPSRQQSPYLRSAATSPTSAMPGSAATLHPPTQVSPSYYLQQRDSPYRPVHNVSTLLYPPPSSALQHRPQSIEFNQMRYQPLSKSNQQDQTGHLPYVAQNVWLNDNTQEAMTPVHQWPGFVNH